MPLLNATIYAGYHVVAIDMPGHGRSQHMPAFCGNYSAECYLRICAALLGKLRRFCCPFDLDSDCLPVYLSHMFGRPQRISPTNSTHRAQVHEHARAFCIAEGA
jgi:pimeloyl-ACP methyl ester carboxylesterase